MWPRARVKGGHRPLALCLPVLCISLCRSCVFLCASPVYISVQVLCISVCWSCVFLCAALCVHIFLLRVETALRRLAHSMSGLRGYYRTNIETPPPLFSSSLQSSSSQGHQDLAMMMKRSTAPSITADMPYGQNTLIFVTTCPSPHSPPTSHWLCHHSGLKSPVLQFCLRCLPVCAY